MSKCFYYKKKINLKNITKIYQTLKTNIRVIGCGVMKVDNLVNKISFLLTVD